MNYVRKKEVEPAFRVKIKLKRNIKPIIVTAPKTAKWAFEGDKFIIKDLGTPVFIANFDEIEWVSEEKIDIK